MARFRSFLPPLVLFLLWVCRLNAYDTLSDESFGLLPGMSDDFDVKNGTILAPILIPRVSGTEGNVRVRNHIADFFKNNLPKWHVSFQNSTSKTPATGNDDVPFVNIMVTCEPPWATVGEVSYLTLAAHYDSKFTPEGFIGATDSAAPCAMIMKAARNIEAALERKWSAMSAENTNQYQDLEATQGVQLLFLDGEEAFVSWTAEDSIYGARALAAEWETTPHPALSTFKNPLASISLFVLLDLLGARAPKVPSYFRMTHWAYAHLAHIEARLRKLGLFRSSPNHPDRAKNRRQSETRAEDKKGGQKKQQLEKRAEPLFLTEAEKKESDRWMGGYIGDDHEPFLERGVEVLHIIPNPFPREWHEMDDNGANLDMDTVEDWTLLVTAFVAEWMELEGFIKEEEKGQVRDRSEL